MIIYAIDGRKFCVYCCATITLLSARLSIPSSRSIPSRDGAHGIIDHSKNNRELAAVLNNRDPRLADAKLEANLGECERKPPRIKIEVFVKNPRTVANKLTLRKVSRPNIFSPKVRS